MHSYVAAIIAFTGNNQVLGKIINKPESSILPNQI